MYYLFNGIGDDTDWLLVERPMNYFSNSGDELPWTQVPFFIHSVLSGVQWSRLLCTAMAGGGGICNWEVIFIYVTLFGLYKTWIRLLLQYALIAWVNIFHWYNLYFF